VVDLDRFIRGCSYCRLRTPASYPREWHWQMQLTQSQREHPLLSGLQSSHFSQSSMSHCPMHPSFWHIFVALTNFSRLDFHLSILHVALWMVSPVKSQQIFFLRSAWGLTSTSQISAFLWQQNLFLVSLGSQLSQSCTNAEHIEANSIPVIIHTKALVIILFERNMTI